VGDAGNIVLRTDWAENFKNSKNAETKQENNRRK
jgi:hypothetical protein